MNGSRSKSPGRVGLTAVFTAALGAMGVLDASAEAPTAQPPKQVTSPASTAPKEPIDITADHGEFFNDERLAVYTGNVESIWGQDRMRTPKMTITFAKRDPAQGPATPAKAASGAAPGAAPGEGVGKVERIEAEGVVYFTTPTQNARGDHATYLAESDTITMIGNVVLVQDKNVSTGDKLVINRSNNHATLFSNTGRVRGVFYQEPQPAPSAAAPKAATKPSGRSPS